LARPAALTKYNAVAYPLESAFGSDR